MQDLTCYPSCGQVRLTVEQNIIFPNVANERVPQLLADPFFQGRFRIDPGTASDAFRMMAIRMISRFKGM
jgi:sulfite reductase beta subunit-like hemoprotein